MNKLDFFKGIKVGAIFGDEMHYGGRTANYKHIKETLKPALDLAVTATPTRFLLKQYKNKFIFTEWQRQLQKNKGIKDFQDAVTPVQFTVKFDEIANIVDTKWGKEKITNMSGAIISDDTKIKEQLVNLIWTDEKYKTISGEVKVNNFNINNVINNCSGANYSDEQLNHGIAILPMNSKKIIEFVKIANRIQKEYLFIAATGSKITDGINPLGDNIECVINNKSKAGIKTVTCTCYMFIEGVTVPEWNYVVWLDNNKSTSKYFQGNGRGLSQNDEKSKKYSFIFDYDWNRCLLLNDEMLHTTMEYSDVNNMEDFFKEYGIHCNPIFLYINGKYQQLNSTYEYHELLAEAIKTSDRVEYILDEFEDEDIINIETIVRALAAQDKALELKLSTESSSLDKFTENFNKAKQKKESGEKLSKEEQDTLKTIAELRNKLRTIINCIPELAFCTKESSFENILNNNKYSTLIIKILNVTQVELRTIFAERDLSKIDMIIKNMFDDFKTLSLHEFQTKWIAQYTTNNTSSIKDEESEVTRNTIDYVKLGLSF